MISYFFKLLGHLFLVAYSAFGGLIIGAIAGTGFFFAFLCFMHLLLPDSWINAITEYENILFYGLIIVCWIFSFFVLLGKLIKEL